VKVARYNIVWQKQEITWLHISRSKFQQQQQVPLALTEERGTEAVNISKAFLRFSNSKIASFSAAQLTSPT